MYKPDCTYCGNTYFYMYCCENKLSTYANIKVTKSSLEELRQKIKDLKN